MLEIPTSNSRFSRSVASFVRLSAVFRNRRSVLMSPNRASYFLFSSLSCTLSCDHQVVDGAVGAVVMKEFKNCLELPLIVPL